MKKQFSTRLKPKTLNQLESLSKDQKRTKTSVLEIAVDRYFNYSENMR